MSSQSPYNTEAWSELSLQSDIETKIKYIRDNFIEPQMQAHPFFSPTASFNVAGNTETTFMNMIFGGLPRFLAKYESEINTGAPLDTSLLARNVKDTSVLNRNSYSTYPLTQTNVNALNVPHVELNMSNFISPTGDLSKVLTKMRRLYNLLHPMMYEKYRYLVASNKVPTTSDKLIIHNYRPASVSNSAGVPSTTTAESITDVAQFEEVKNLIYEMMVDTYVMGTTRLMGQEAVGGNLKIEMLTEDQVKQQGITTLDKVLRLRLDPTVSTATAGSTNAITLPTPPPNKSMRVIFTHKMESGPNNVDTGKLRLTIGNGAQTDAKVVNSTWNWQTASFAFNNLTPNMTLKLENLFNGVDANKKNILITNLKVEYVASSEANIRGTTDYVMPVFTDTDLFAVRRLLRLYELVAHLYIAAALYKHYKTVGTDAAATAKAERLTTMCINMLRHASVDINRDNPTQSNESVADLIDLVTKRIKTFKNDTGRINELDTITSQYKMNMRVESERLMTTRAKEGKSTTLLYVALVIMIVVSLVSVSAYFSPVEKARKLYIIGITFAVAIILALIINVMYNKQVESFVGAENQGSQDTQTLVLGALETAKLVIDSNMTAASDYLSNTINIALILDSYRTYGNINQIMNKERRFYEDRAQQMDITNTKLSTANNAVYLKQVSQKSSIFFFIYLMILICLTLVAVLLLDSIPGSTPIVFTVAGIALVILVVAHIMDTRGRVNTAAEKYYWSQPNTNGLT